MCMCACVDAADFIYLYQCIFNEHCCSLSLGTLFISMFTFLFPVGLPAGKWGKKLISKETKANQH